MKKPVFAVDIGNTHIACGIYHEDALKHSWRIGTDASKTEDEYFSVLDRLFDHAGIGMDQIGYVALSCVVPPLTRVFDHITAKYFNAQFLNVNSATNTGLTYPMEDPSYIGADLIVNAYAAWKKYQDHCIVCDFGTATTIQLVGNDGFFHGAIIAPGVMTSSTNLIQKTSQLSAVRLEKPVNVLGTSTRDAMLSGIVGGSAHMIDGFINEIRATYAHLGQIKAIATGGIAGLIGENAKTLDTIDKTLTLDGLNMICRKIFADE